MGFVKATSSETRGINLKKQHELFGWLFFWFWFWGRNIDHCNNAFVEEYLASSRCMSLVLFWFDGELVVLRVRVNGSGSAGLVLKLVMGGGNGRERGDDGVGVLLWGRGWWCLWMEVTLV